MWKTLSLKCVERHPLRLVELAYSYNEWGFLQLVTVINSLLRCKKVGFFTVKKPNPDVSQSDTNGDKNHSVSSTEITIVNMAFQVKTLIIDTQTM